MREQNTTAKEGKKNLKMNIPLSPHPHPSLNQPPIPLISSHITYNSNTQDMAFLRQMRQSNKSGNVK